MFNILRLNFSLLILTLRVGFLFIPFFINCTVKSDNDIFISNIFIDPRDNQQYTFVTIGNFFWIAENLNYKTETPLNSWCYANNDSNCKKYGRLYDWDAAMQSCPDGWRLPSLWEWINLFRNTNNSSMDSLGFSTLLGGYRDSANRFFFVDDVSYWWVATEFNQYRAHSISLSPEGMALLYLGSSKFDGYSVRCLKRNYMPDIAIAMRVKESMKKISRFDDYELYLDSLLANSYGTVLAWCNTMRKDSSELINYYIENCYRKDYFLKYYNERCVKPAQKFESSTTGIHYRRLERSTPCSFTGILPDVKFINCDPPRTAIYYISIVKTETGALAKFSLTGNHIRPRYLEVEFDKREWFDFIRTLYEFNFAEWENFKSPSVNFKAKFEKSKLSEAKLDWEFFVYSLDSVIIAYTGNRNDGYNHRQYKSDFSGKLPPNWEEFNKRIMEEIIGKMWKKADAGMDRPWWF
ncbi:MAG: hypothetical protein LBU83_11485 [Bacteroidales bacterium]|jgi:uncharacterized protein (TIGR02145 family)|nr:hypothetical protein [Bacteroidales bacterium]